MADIPTSEPLSVTAGDTVQWRRDLADYPASASWVLKYRLINAAGKIDITASADGAAHLVSVTAATSAGWAAGTYTWQAYVEKAPERYTVGTGTIEIKRNLAAEAAGYDTRTTARKIVEELEEAYLSYSTNGQGAVQRYTIGGREMWFRSSADFVKLIEYWRGQVKTEEAAEAIANGLGNPRKMLVRFA